MSRYFNSNLKQMGRGSTSRAATLAPPISRSAAGIASSIARKIAGGRIPPPPAGAIPAAALLIGAGLIWKFMNKEEPNGTNWIPGYGWELTNNCGTGTIRYAWSAYANDPLPSAVNCSYSALSFWDQAQFTPPNIPPDAWFIYSGGNRNRTFGDIRKTHDKTWTRIEQGADMEMTTPGTEGYRYIPIFRGPGIPARVSVPSYQYQNPSRRGPIAGSHRGTGFLIRSGAGTVPVAGVINPMYPMREIKNAASAKTSAIINSTIGFLGEGFDMTRCFLGAVGNTYLTRDGKEKVIPKWQWASAMGDLSGGKTVISKGNRTPQGVVFRDGVFINRAQNRIITPEQAGERLAKCLLLNALEDWYFGERGKVVGQLARNYGFAAGPLGLDSLWQLSQGNTPYEGLFDLHL